MEKKGTFAKHKTQNMNSDNAITLSLTGADSHKVKIQAGQGSFSIGQAGRDKKKYDVLVEKDLPVNWNAFDAFTTPAGGLWPRFFYYWGNDTGFVKWSEKRAVEDFSWCPDKPVSIDLSAAQIRSLYITAKDTPVNVILDHQNTAHSGIQRLGLFGIVEHFDIAATHANPFVIINPQTKKEKSALPYQLPHLKSLARITSLDIAVEPLAQAFDCQSLLQFPHLKNLNITGNMANVACLSKLKNLERIGIRYAPDIEHFPALNSWPHLKSFIGWNIDSTTGKRLSTELKQLAKEKELEYSSVSKLRSAVWFTTEYGIPFTNWEPKKAKIATKAYKTAVKEIAKAKTEKEVKTAVAGLISIINNLPDIETVEREDTGLAVSQLVEVSSLNISPETGNKWFDEFRDF
ncbi:hypothetical protein [Empedobacter brevis]|nr:hypothetical protein [Empedobacter brevis]